MKVNGPSKRRDRPYQWRQIEALAQGERKHPAMSRVMEVFA